MNPIHVGGKLAEWRKRVNASGPERRKHRQRIVRRLTRAEARQLVAAYVLQRLFKHATVRDDMEARLKVSARDRWATEGVYLNLEQSALESSQVVVVCKRSGWVFYAGFAGDEG